MGAPPGHRRRLRDRPVTAHDDAEFFGDEEPSAAEQAWWASISDGIDRSDEPPDTLDPPDPWTPDAAAHTTSNGRRAPVVVADEKALLDGHRPTDLGNADRLVAHLDGRARYVDTWGKWLVWTDEGVWRVDPKQARIIELAKQVPRAMFRLASETGSDSLWKWAKRSEAASSIKNMIDMARGTPGVLLDHHQLDAHPWLLNVTNGVLDLRTGQLHPHDPDLLLTCQAPCAYDPDAQAPLFEACLEVWQPDPTVRAFLARAAGTSLTGVAVEKVFVNLGDGGNGKGKFYGALQDTLGPDYSVVPHKSLLVMERHSQHDTVVARLRGARMAIAGETDAGDRLDDAKVKMLTGGDLLEARRMREDPWQFRPSHTLFLHTNHRPRVRGDDEGIWRRLRLIPWDVTIPPGDRDEHLAAKLAAEAPGILAWAVRGCLEWQTHGLGEPDPILDATAQYRAGEDHVGRFLADCCYLGDTARVPAADLRSAYETWCDNAGETVWSAKAVGQKLQAKGLDTARLGNRNIRTWIGIGLLETTTHSDEPEELF